jgi:hypothetical protein
MIDYNKCLEAGCIGGIGAIPGTLAAQGFDVIKIRQQLTGDPLRRAIIGIYNGGGNGRRASSKAVHPSISHFFAGSFPAVKQKMATRTPMFLVSAASVQMFETRLGFNPASAAFVGSAVSGYLTGCLASPWEWQKVLVSQRVASPAAGKGLVGLIHQVTVHHGIAAICAVTVDYAFDVSAKRTYAIPPESKIPSLGVTRHVIHITTKEGLKIFLGLPIKTVEFAVSYAITGLLSPYVSNFVEELFGEV